MTYKPSKLGKADLVFGLLSKFISRSVHVAAMICATLVNTQTDSFCLTKLLAQPAELKAAY